LSLDGFSKICTLSLNESLFSIFIEKEHS
jgi:hypothetical protein